jgi:hypothetical protein
MSAMSAASVRQSRLVPSSPLGQRLCEIFAYLWQTISGDNAATPDWKTNTKYPLRPRVLWEMWNDASTLVGVRFGKETLYALLDIDRGSAWHPANNPKGLSLIYAALETIGIVRHVVIKSSASGGLHIYLPLPYGVSTFGLASAVKQCLEAQDIAIAAGQVEIFPNTKAYAIAGTYIEYNAHRLPLQPDSGSCLLDDDGQVLGQDLGQFLKLWDRAADGQDFETLNEAIGIARRNGSKRRRRKLSPVDDWKADLQTEIDQGWTGYGQTNALLKTIACYGVVFEGLTGSALAEFVQTTAINAKGYKDYCRHRHEITLRATVWAKAAEKYYWALGTDPSRITNPLAGEDGGKVVSINKNAERAQDAQRRIREAMAHLKDLGQLPTDVTERLQAIIVIAHTSPQTLYRYPELWHPAHLSPLPETEPVIAQKKAVTEIFYDEIPEPSKSLKISEGGELHTLEKNMKCKADLDRSLGHDLPIHEISGAVVINFLPNVQEEIHLIGNLLEKPHEESIGQPGEIRRET